MAVRRTLRTLQKDRMDGGGQYAVPCWKDFEAVDQRRRVIADYLQRFEGEAECRAELVSLLEAPLMKVNDSTRRDRLLG